MNNNRKATIKKNNEYNDGEDVTHYLGNGDYKDENGLGEKNKDKDLSDVGKVAYGNNLSASESENEEDEGALDHISADSQDRVLTEDEMIDQASMESFPASDPPGFRSTSGMDQETHDRHFK